MWWRSNQRNPTMKLRIFTESEIEFLISLTETMSVEQMLDLASAFAIAAIRKAKKP